MRMRSKEQMRRVIVRFTNKDNCGCWIWARSKNSRGYGQIWSGDKSLLAHRVSYHAFLRRPGKLNVCHRCDVPACCNPDHLFLGTHADNLNDSYNKRRRRLKIPPEIRPTLKAELKSGLSGNTLARKYKVDRACIWYWKRKFKQEDSNGK